jgi:hypothetical protein
MVWASLLKELLEVICDRPRLTLATARYSHGAHDDGAACLLVDAAIVAGCDCGLLAALPAPFLAALGASLAC